jgi:hypothetical protein
MIGLPGRVAVRPGALQANVVRPAGALPAGQARPVPASTSRATARCSVDKLGAGAPPAFAAGPGC